MTARAAAGKRGGPSGPGPAAPPAAAAPSRRRLRTLSLAGAGILWAVPAGAGEPCWHPRAIPGPVAADLVRVVDAATLVVQARPWPELEVLATVRVVGARVPDDPALAELARAQLQAVILLSARPLWLHDILPVHDDYAVRAVVLTGDGTDLGAPPGSTPAPDPSPEPSPAAPPW